MQAGGLHRLLIASPPQLTCPRNRQHLDNNCSGLQVVLKNDAKIDVSLHPHGVRYSKANEGTLYEDGTSGADKADDVVAPGTTYTYVWNVRDRACGGAVVGRWRGRGGVVEGL